MKLSILAILLLAVLVESAAAGNADSARRSLRGQGEIIGRKGAGGSSSDDKDKDKEKGEKDKSKEKGQKDKDKPKKHDSNSNKNEVDCSDVACILRFCEGQFIPDGECCPVCPPPSVGGIEPDCSAVSCLACEDEEEAIFAEGECCPVCVKSEEEEPDCSLVLCEKCAEDEEAIFVDGECCPVCEPKGIDCSLVRCAQPVCEFGYEPVKDGCCETCQLKPNCQIVQCIRAPCPPICEGEEPEPCPEIECKPGYEPVVADGDLCPTCQLTPCYEFGCMDPCFDHETNTSKCAKDEQCVTETIYQSGGGPHCPEIGCPHFVGCE